MYMWIAVLVLVGATLSLSCVCADVPPLLPQPQSFSAGVGTFSLDQTATIVFEGTGRTSETAFILRDWLLRDVGVELAVSDAKERTTTSRRIILRLGRGPKDDESYTLKVGADNIEIVGGERGLYYGASTLAQLALIGKSVIAGCLVEDWPSLRVRGWHVCPRERAIAPSVLKRMFEEAGRLKLNMIQLEMDDFCEYKSFPEVNPVGQMKREDLTECLHHAKKHFVEVVPVFNSYAHSGAFTQGYPDTFGSARHHRCSWCPSKPRTYEVLGKIYDELAETFRDSRYINVTCDEVLGWYFQGCKLCNPAGLKGDMNNPDPNTDYGRVFWDVYVRHVNKLAEMCKARDKKMMVFGNLTYTRKEVADRFSPKDDIVALYWAYKPYGVERMTSEARNFADAGIRTLCCPSAMSGTNEEGGLPFIFGAIHRLNIDEQTKVCLNLGDKGLGLITTTWPKVADKADDCFWDGYAYTAYRSWNAASRDTGWDRAFGAFLFGDCTPDEIEAAGKKKEGPWSWLLWNELSRGISQNPSGAKENARRLLGIGKSRAKRNRVILDALEVPLRHYFKEPMRYSPWARIGQGSRCVVRGAQVQFDGSSSGDIKQGTVHRIPENKDYWVDAPGPVPIPIAEGLSSYVWSFGDGGVSSAARAVHVYNTPGLYKVLLTVTNDLGMSDVDTIWIEVK